MQNYKKLLILIILLAAVLRFYKLGQNPPSMDWDETAHGYNAYSILRTARDEYGLKLPLYFRSFDDYKPPLYTYLVVPSVAVFGLNNFAVRFPSAVLGTFAVLFTYLMVFELFKKKEIALLSALFLAISPWHLQFSRVAFETNSAIFFSTVGTWAFLKGIKSHNFERGIYLIISAVFFGANMFIYHNARVFVPLFSLVLLVLYGKELLREKKWLIFPTVISVIFTIILIPIVTSIAGQERFKGTTIFSDQSPLYKNAATIKVDSDNGQLLIGKILHNRRLVYVPIIIENYLSHFNPQFLFFTADMDRHHAPLIGLLYWWDIPFLLAGIFLLINKNYSKETKIIIISWFLIAPVAASVTWGVPHSLRSEIFLPTFQIFIALGFWAFYNKFQKNKNVIIFISLLLVCNFLFYMHEYYVHLPIEYSKAWLYGRKEAADYSESVKANYDNVVVSTKLEQPHEFWLYYTKYDPKKYLAEGGTISGGFLESRNHFDKYEFKPIDFQNQKKDGKTLFVGLPEEIPASAHILKKIYYLSGEPAIYIADENSN